VNEMTQQISDSLIAQHEAWWQGIGAEDDTYKRSCLEDHIEDAEHKARSSWVTMGWALRKIRDEDLWKPEYNTFADYVQDKLGYKKSWAYEIIDAGEVALSVPITATSQARVLTDLTQEAQEAVWDKAQEIAAEGGSRGVTVKALKEARDIELGGPAPTSEPEPPATPVDPPIDTGVVSSRHERASAMRAMRAQLKSLAEEIMEEASCGDGGHWFDGEQFLESMKNASRLLRLATPEADCPYCRGKGDVDCDVCQNLRWLPKGVYDSLPADMKE
jgi:hypothetical protein